MKRIIGIIALLLALCALFSGCGGEQIIQNVETLSPEELDNTFRVAMAIADITPKNAVYLEGYEGKDQWSLSTPDKFTSDLLARILLVQKGEECLVFLNLEYAVSDANHQYNSISSTCMERIAQICQTEQENILLSNTHTHQANLVLEESSEDNIVRAVEQAYQNLAPAKIGTGVVNTQYGISRSNNYTMDPDKPYDNRMTVIRFDNAQTGEPIGLVYSVPMHNTMLGNAPGSRQKHNLLNCEFTGYASRALEEQFGSKNNPFVAMHINGFYGNAGPYVDGKYYADSVEELKEFGEEFAEEIAAAYKNIKTYAVTGEIKAAYIKDAIPTNKEDRSFAATFKNLDEMPMYMSVGAFGDIAFIGVNFEPFSIIGARLKAEAPYTTVLPAANVHGWRGYIPTKETFESHQYVSEAECSPGKTPFDASAEEIFYEKALNALCDLAEVTLTRVPFQQNGTQTGAGVYNFVPENVQTLDRLVISFGQQARTDCASEFEVLMFDESGNLCKTERFANNSVNYLGIDLEDKTVASVSVIVTERYGGGSVEELTPVIWGIQYAK